MVTRADVIREALSWEGVPWRHQGRLRETGIDCGGLVIVIGLELGLSDFNPTDYPPRPNGTFIRYFDEGWIRIKKVDMRPGDILIFNEARLPCHSGILATKYGKPSVVHAHATRRRVIHETLEEAKTVIGSATFAFKYEGLED